MGHSKDSGNVKSWGATDDPLGVNSEVGRKLKEYYSEILTENVPDRFTELLMKLDAVEPKLPKD